jgi:hypothetical protein
MECRLAVAAGAGEVGITMNEAAAASKYLGGLASPRQGTDRTLAGTRGWTYCR